MCRIAGFIGTDPLPLRTLICDPPHGLSHQSWAAQEMVSATVNADGWGAAWFDDAGKPAGYRQILPIWADANLDSLGLDCNTTCHWCELGSARLDDVA